MDEWIKMTLMLTICAICLVAGGCIAGTGVIEFADNERIKGASKAIAGIMLVCGTVAWMIQNIH